MTPENLESIYRLSPVNEGMLSFAQERLWSLDQLQGGALNNVPLALRMSGELRVALLARALAEVRRRHQVLRAVFRGDGGDGGGGQVRQMVLPPAGADLGLVDLTALPIARRQPAAAEGIAAEARRPFDLARGPLLRTRLFQLGETEHLLLVELHPIVGDGWSTGVLVREVAALYRAFFLGEASPLGELPVQYADFAAWQRSWLSGEVLARQLAFWREHLAGAPPVLELPTDRPRPQLQNLRGRRLAVDLDRSLADALVALGQRHRATLFMVLAAAFQALLARTSGAPEICLGTPVAGRTRPETEGLIGPFANTLVLRGDLSRDPTFADHLAAVRRDVVAASEHQELPFAKLLAALVPEHQRSLAHTPLFQVMLALQNAPVGPLDLPGVRLEPLALENPCARFDLTLTLAEAARGLAGSMEYGVALFDRATIARLAAQLETLLRSVTSTVTGAAGAEQRISALALLGAAERQQLLVEWRGQAGQAPAVTVPERLALQASRTPTAVALEWRDQRLTYGELARRAGLVARRLRAAGVGAETRVGLLVERSLDLVTGLLGIWLAGGAAVPLDPGQPASRLQQLLDDALPAGAAALVSQRSLAELHASLRLGSLPVVWMEDAAQAAAEAGPALSPPAPGDLAYLVYTSGSTGRPKAVMVEHGSLAHTMAAYEACGLAVAERVPILAPATFDAFFCELLPLLTGGTAVLFDIRPVLDQQLLLAELERATVLFATPALMRQLTAALLERAARGSRPPRLRWVWSGGEAVGRDLVAAMRRAFPGSRIGVLYGPTETTVDALWDEPDAETHNGLGWPLPGVTVEVRDAAWSLAPAGSPGELWLGGPGLARGYLGRPDLTAERFVPSPSGRGARLYRSGDLVRFRPNGRLEFLGRMDQQVKLRGIRVEPGEVEAVLADFPGVAAAAVLVRRHAAGDERLVACVAAAAGLQIGELRRFAESRLPSYMVPNQFVLLEGLPLTRHGKVDRRALSELAMAEAPAAAAAREPQAAARAVAIVGMAGRFPGAPDLAAFWRNLRDGIESISFFTDAELDRAGVRRELRQTPGYVAAAGVLPEADLFDAGFFDVGPREAQIMDPQQRVLLEVAAEALERAGYGAGSLAAGAARIGVFAGGGTSTYALNHLIGRAEFDGLELALGNDSDFLATRLSYKLDLKGPAVTVQTACSTSLVAVHQAVRSLLDGECDLALAGGVNVTSTQFDGHVYQEGGIVSPDGHNRAFDARAKGSVSGNGAGVVVLKPLARALADGDPIHAVVLGSALNNDGAGKVGFTAPAELGQAQVIAAAQAAAGVSPESIGYVEAHGSATPVGDPIEIAALTRAFRAGTARQGFCAVGSVKTNIGHNGSAAGIAGLLKTVLALAHGQIPASLHYERPNPQIDFASSPFYVPRELAGWPAGGAPRRAGVSSFGLGGTNVHVVLEEAPAPPPAAAPSRPWQPLVLSARTAAALEAATDRLVAHLEAHPDADLADVAATLATGRKGHSWRRAVVCRDTREARQLLAARDPRRLLSATVDGASRPVAFLFSGPDEQYPAMAAGLYRDEPAFRERLDRHAAVLAPLLGVDPLAVLFAPAAPLAPTAVSQPLLFAVELALAELWRQWGVEPQAMLGHGLGEYVAACVAGVFSAEAALRLVVERARRIDALSPGAMLAVPLGREELQPLLPDQAWMAAVDGPRTSVVSGTPAAIAQLARRLDEQGIASRLLATTHALHCPLLAPAAAALAELLRQVPLAAPRIPCLSSLTGTWITASQATDPGYWAEQLCRPVQFAAGVAELWREPGRVLVEIGPGANLASLALQQPAGGAADPVAVSSLPEAYERQPDRAHLLGAAARLWLSGVRLDWRAVWGGERRRRLALPTYPFERQRYWIERLGPAARTRLDALPETAPESGPRLYLPAWRLTPSLPAPDAARLRGQGAPWLVLSDDAGLGRCITARLRQAGARVVEVAAGDGFAALGADAFRVDPREPGDYGLLVAALAREGEERPLPRRIVHLWGVQKKGPWQRRCASCLLGLVQALDRAARTPGTAAALPALRVLVAADGLHPFAAAGRRRAELAPLAALCRALPRELPGIACRAVDVELPRGAVRRERLAAALLAEIAAIPDTTETAGIGDVGDIGGSGEHRQGRGTPWPGGIALRAGERWAEAFELVPADPAAPSRPLAEDATVLLLGRRAGLLAAAAVALGRMGVRTVWDQGESGPTAAGAAGATGAAGEAPAPLAGVIVGEEALLGELPELPLAQGMSADLGAWDAALAGVADRFAALVRRLTVQEAGFCLVASSFAPLAPRPGEALRAAAGSLADALAEEAGWSAPAVAWGRVVWDARLEEPNGAAPPAVGEAVPAQILASVLAQLAAGEGTEQLVVSRGEPSPPRATAFPGTLHGRPNLKNPYVAPRSESERRLAAIWQDLLGIDPIGIHDSFFELGGDSLLAVQVIARVRDAWGVEIAPRELFEARTPAALAAAIAALRAADGIPAATPAIVPAARPQGRESRGPLSFAQQRLWFIDQLEGGALYNVPMALRVDGALSVAVLSRTLQEVVRRHEVLRTVFPAVDGRSQQVILPPAGLALPLVELTGLPAALRQPVAARLVAAEARRPFDLARGTRAAASAGRPTRSAGLFRAGLWRLGQTEHLLLLNLHHIVSDGWSLGVLLREIATLYGAFAAGGPSPLPELPVQYADFAIWQRSWLQGEVLDEHLDYWRRQLAGVPPVLALPLDRPRPPVQTFPGATRPLQLERGLSDAVGELCRSRGVTPFMVLLAAWTALLGRHAGQDDVPVGTPVAGRGRRETEGLIGFFVNTLVLRGDLAGNPSFAELLDRVRRTSLDAFAHQDLPFERIVEAIAVERNRAVSPLFQVFFAFQNIRLGTLDLSGLRLAPLDVHTGLANFDLTLTLQQGPAGFAGTLEHNTDLFDGSTAERLAAHFATLLRAAMDDPGLPVQDLPLLPAWERQQSLVEWCDTDRALAPVCLHQLVEAQLDRAPDAVALIAGDRHLSCAELEARANRVARHLRSLAVGPDQLVGLCTDRSPEMVIGMLGILKAGGAYLPLDPAYPRERLAFLMEDSGVRVLLTEGDLAERVPAGAARVVRLDGPAFLGAASGERRREGGATPASLAYVIYTSGSTGKPKGAGISHAAVVNLLASMQARPGMGTADALLAVTTLSFDIAALEIYLPLVCGARLLLASRQMAQDGELLRQALAAGEVTVMQATPATWRLLLAAGWTGARGLTVLCGGEALARDLADQLLGACDSLWNVYGPTETTIWSSLDEVAPGGEGGDRVVGGGGVPSVGGGAVAIGRPLDNTGIYLVSPRLEAVPAGVAGELLIGGAGLARGYHGRPDLTAEKFVPHPLAAARPAAGARLYRTGDLARHLAGGRIEYLGRIDHQVKVRGFRIEPGEIEAALGRHPELRQAVVAVREDRPGDQRLVAWVVPSGERAPAAAELRSYLAERLPEPLVPAAFVALASLPLLPNGKVDRRALPAPEWTPAAAAASLPRTPAEELLAGIFAEVLGLPGVGAEDDFFTLGGHSLLATQLVARIFQVFGVELPLRAVFESRTLAQMAARIAALRGAAAAGAGMAPPLVPRAAGADARGLPLSFAQERLWFLDQLVPDNPFYNIYNALRIEGPLDEATLERAVREVMHRHEGLRTVFAERDGIPVQVVQSAPARGLATIDLTALGAAPRRAEADRLAGAEGRRPHNLTRGPLLRAHLVRLSAGDRLLMLNVHHIAADGWSMDLLSRELAALYGAFARGEPSPLPPLAVQYPDFALWQREWLAAGPLAAQLDYWRRQLAGLDEALDLPADRPRSAVESFRGGHLDFALAPRLAADLTALARRHGATPAMALLAAFQALLGRDTGRRDVPVGVAIANRTRREVEDLIGFFVNTLVLRLDLGGRPGLGALLGRVRDVALAAYDHQDLPFERLVEDLNPGRSLARNPLVQVLFGFQNFPRTAVAVGGLTFAPLAENAADPGTSKFDLTLFVFEHGASLSANLEYNSDLFDAATVRRLTERFQALLTAAVGDPQAPVAALPLLGAAERHQLLHEWNPGATSYPAEPGLAALFARQAARRPAAPAVRYGDTLLTYGELRRRAGRLARRLRAQGVGVDTRVGLAVERSPHLVAAMLGIVEAGGAYVPLDPDYPRARLDYILRDCGLQVLVATRTALAALPAPPADMGVAHVVLVGEPGDDAAEGGSPVAPSALASPGAGAASLAYVIYTSGSTGEPKGVEVPQGAVARLVLATDYLQLGPDDRVGQAANANFDAITFEVWGPLLNGGCIVGIDKDVALAPAALARLLRDQQVTAMFLTSSLFNQVVREEPGAFAGLDTLLVGGEAVDPGWVRKLLAGAPPRRLLNGYGPTESTTFASWHRVAAPPADGATVPIGLPLANTSLHVLDGELQPVPIGVAGQLAIGGDGLARGYCRRPAATAERFVPDPFAGPAGARLYLTGDRVRRRADGAIEFLGRLDRQVKIRGFRIEPGEIEARLREHPAVGDCVVAALPAAGGDGSGKAAAAAPAERRLVAYVVQDPDWQGGEEAGTQHDQVTQWGVVFDDIYHRDAADPDPTFNFVGWDSTYTGEPLPRAQMVEWLDDTLARISALAPRRVLEIGCGTGMLLFRLAPRCELYWGADVSARALAYVQSRLGDLAGDPGRVRLLARPADCFDGIAPGSFDTVILNSVVQYFPSAEYLAGVLAAAAAAVRPGGAIFLGDVRSLSLLPAFHLAVELARADPALPLAALRSQVLARRQLENELALSPAFFADLQRRVPAIRRVEIHPKRGHAHNELTAFRYQVVLRIGASHGATDATHAAAAIGAAAAPAWRDWRAGGLTLERLQSELQSDGAGLIALSGIPNLRLATDVAAARLAWEDVPPEAANGHGTLHAGGAKAAAAGATAGDLRRRAAAAAAASGAVDPQALWDLAAQLSYDIEIGWAAPGADGAFTALLRRRPAAPAAHDAAVPPLAELLPQPAPGATAAELANRPLRGRFARRLAPELRAFLGARLPEPMLPAAFVLLDALPLNANGKLDIQRLPPPEAARGAAAGTLSAPRTPLEERLAAIWAELLGLARVGVDESFFDLGGHSLIGAQLISRLRQVLEVDLPLRLLFEAPTVAAMAVEIELLQRGAGARELRTIASFGEVRDSPPPLSFAQERYWSGRHLEARSVASTVPLLMHLQGPLDLVCLRQAIAAVVERHELLRTSFQDGPAGPTQVIHPMVPLHFPIVDLGRLGAAERMAEVRRFSIVDGRLHFDYQRPPLFRQTLFRGAADEHILLFTIHHVAADWWSGSILIGEVSALYLAIHERRPSPLPPVVAQFQDFARWQRRLSQEEAHASQVTFWRDHLHGALPIDLNPGRPRPQKPTYTAAVEEVHVPADLEKELDAFSARHGVTLFMTLLAAFKALLHHETGQDDLVVPCSFANRNQFETESLMGNLAVNLPLRTRLAGVETFRDLLQRVRHVTLQAHDHPDIFWEPVVAGMSFLEEGDRGGLTTFRILFQLIKAPPTAEAASDLRITQLGVDTGKIRLDMSLFLTQDNGLSGRFRYHRDILDKPRVARMRHRFLRILAAIVADPDRPLADLAQAPADPIPQEPIPQADAVLGS